LAVACRRSNLKHYIYDKNQTDYCLNIGKGILYNPTVLAIINKQDLNIFIARGLPTQIFRKL
jgi:hypothetical protein